MDRECQDEGFNDFDSILDQIQQNVNQDFNIEL